MKLRRSTCLELEPLERRDLLTTLVDFDADGDLDLITDQGWHENYDTFGNFIVHDFSPLTSATPGDMDGDGDLDIVGIDGWLENTDGQGSLGDLQGLPVPDSAAVTQIRLQDVGLDGDMDVIMHGTERVLHFDRIDGQGDFALVDDFSFPDLMDAGDVDNDGRVDALVLVGLREFRGVGTWVQHNLGDGQFESSLWHQDLDPQLFPEDPNLVEQTYSARLFDANDDGWLDVVRLEGADDFASIVLHANDQQGNSAEAQVAISSCLLGCSYVYDDFDDDGAVDVILLADAVFYLYHNDGTGNFERPDVYDLTRVNNNVVAAGDINGDGLIDVATDEPGWHDSATGQQHVPGETIQLQEPGPHTFVSSQPFARSEGFIRASALGDVNGDDKMELITATDSIEVWEAGQEPRVVLRSPRYVVSALDVADMDADGDADILFYDFRRLAWLENIGGGEFKGIRKIADEPSSWGLGDINQDGLLDVVTATREAGALGDSTISLHLNQGEFYSSTKLEMSTKSIYDLVVADVDGDQDLDVFADTARWRDENNNRRVSESIWFENIDGQLGGEEVMGDGESSRSLYSDDLNGDGRADLIVSGFSRAFWKDAFGQTERLIVDDGHRISVADVDDDGDLDIVGNKENRVVWYENRDGEGQFSEMQVVGTAHVSDGVHVGDLTGNGQDEVVAVDRRGRITVFEKRVTGDSNGDGTFDSADLVTVFRHGEYEDNVWRNSTFESGDWNQDGEFDSSDFVFVMQAGTYVRGARSVATSSAQADQQLAARFEADRFFALNVEDDDEDRLYGRLRDFDNL